jgi:hypothetical protein
MITYHRFASLDAATPDKKFAPVHIKHLKAVVPCGSIVFSVTTKADSLAFDTSTTKLIGRILAVANQLDHIPSSERKNMSRRPASIDPRERFVPEVASSLDYCWVPAGFVVELAFVFTPEATKASLVTV